MTSCLKKNCENLCAKEKCATIPMVYSEDANRFLNLFDSDSIVVMGGL